MFKRQNIGYFARRIYYHPGMLLLQFPAIDARFLQNISPAWAEAILFAYQASEVRVWVGPCSQDPAVANPPFVQDILKTLCEAEFDTDYARLRDTATSSNWIVIVAGRKQPDSHVHIADRRNKSGAACCAKLQPVPARHVKAASSHRRSPTALAPNP